MAYAIQRNDAQYFKEMTGAPPFTTEVWTPNENEAMSFSTQEEAETYMLNYSMGFDHTVVSLS